MEDKMFSTGKKHRLLSLERRMGGEAKMFGAHNKHRHLSLGEQGGGKVEVERPQVKMLQTK